MVLISDDPSAEETQGNITEEETEREDERDEKGYDDEIDELAEDNKENVEVPVTVPRPLRGAAQVVTSQSSPSVQRMASPPHRHPATQVRGSPRARKSPAKAAESETGTQPWAVRDSQSSQQRISKERGGPALNTNTSGPQSSLESRNIILQSQISQKSRSPVSSSSMPVNDAADSAAIQLPSSSPPRLVRSQFRMPETSSGGLDDPSNLDKANDQMKATTTEEALQSSVHSGTMKAALLMRENQSDKLGVSAMADNTRPETSSIVRGAAAVCKNCTELISRHRLLPANPYICV